METLKPKQSEVANDIGVAQEKLVSDIKRSLENALPEGYMLRVDENSLKVGLVSDFKLKDSKGLHIVSVDCELFNLWHNLEMGISLSRRMSPIDIYKLSEVMQIIVSINTKIIGDFEVIK